MPFRIRTRQQCLTSYRSDILVVNTSTCINYHRRGKGFMETYHEPQLFFMYPLLKGPQKIEQYSTFPNHKHLCLTANLDRNLLRNSSTNSVPLNMLDCTLTSDLKQVSSQMFTIERVSLARIDNHEVNKRAVTNLPPLTAVIIKWRNPHSSEVFCMTIVQSVLTLRKCRKASTTFVLERTVSNSEAYRPGVVIGKWPTWGD